MKQELVTIPAAAAELTVSTRTLRRMIAAGIFRVVQVSPGRIALKRADLEAHKDRQTRGETPCSTRRETMKETPRGERRRGTIVSFSDYLARTAGAAR